MLKRHVERYGWHPLDVFRYICVIRRSFNQVMCVALWSGFLGVVSFDFMWYSVHDANAFQCQVSGVYFSEGTWCLFFGGSDYEVRTTQRCTNCEVRTTQRLRSEYNAMRNQLLRPKTKALSRSTKPKFKSTNSVLKDTHDEKLSQYRRTILWTRGHKMTADPQLAKSKILCMLPEIFHHPICSRIRWRATRGSWTRSKASSA